MEGRREEGGFCERWEGGENVILGKEYVVEWLDIELLFSV